jgi:CubicO group peptidase (beta-lactamase class C family)
VKQPAATQARHEDGLPRARPAAAGVNAARVLAFLDDVEEAGLELHSLMIWRDGAVAAEGWRWPYRPDRLRMLHSATKSVTACAIGMLVDSGQLALADPIARFFPEQAIDPGSRAARITVEDLLTMRSGHDHEVSGAVWRGIESSWIEEFFRIPIEHEPGKVHVYSSAASYMLSAIVTRLTGETLHRFLTPRLFAPLGIDRVRWDLGPDGLNPGGNGISLTVADALKLGILHERKGLWEGRRILSERWVEQATRPQGAPDYGYHWVIGDQYYAALGIFVQMIAVYPAARAVLAVNGAMEESSVLLPHLRRHFPAAFEAGIDPGADEALARRLEGWRAAQPLASCAQGDPAAFEGNWRVAENTLGVTGLAFRFEGEALELIVTDGQSEHALRATLDGWTEAPVSLPAPSLHHGYALPDAPALAGARWTGETRLEIVLHFAETAFRDTLRFEAEDGKLIFDRCVNINSGERAWPRLSAECA